MNIDKCVLFTKWLDKSTFKTERSWRFKLNALPIFCQSCITFTQMKDEHVLQGESEKY